MAPHDVQVTMLDGERESIWFDPATVLFLKVEEEEEEVEVEEEEEEEVEVEEEEESTSAHSVLVRYFITPSRRERRYACGDAGSTQATTPWVNSIRKLSARHGHHILSWPRIHVSP